MPKAECKYFSRSSVLKWRFFLVFLSGFLCVTASISTQVRLWNNRLETAQRQYGLWQGMRLDINEKDWQILNAHALLEQVGTQETFGLLETASGSFLTGTADQSFYDLANFSLIQGRLPETGDEILVESRVLDQLGMAYEPGSQITGSIQGIQKQFVIAGIIDNYSASWISGDRLPAVFTGPDSGLRPIQRNAFIRGERPAVVQDLKQTMPLLTRNVHVHETWEPFSPENTAWSLMTVFSLAGSGFLIFLVFRKWLKSHRQDIQVLKGIGVSSRKIRRDLFRTVFQPATVAVLVSLTVGLLLGWTAPVLLAAGGLMMTEGLLLFFLMLQEIRRISPVENSSEKDLPETVKAHTSMKRITAQRLGFRFLEDRRFSLAGNLLLGSLLAGALSGALLSLAETWQLEDWLQEKPDFILSLDPEGMQTYRTGDDLENLLDVFETDDRFSRVDAGFVQMNGWTIPVKEGSLLDQIRKDPNISGESRDSILFPSYLLPEDKRDRQVVSLISRENLDPTDVEGFEEELWTSGQGVILYLPDMTVQNGDLWFASELTEPGQVESEGSYRTGETIVLQDPFGNEVETRIAGILRTQPPGMRFDELMGSSMAYTIFAAPAFFEHPVNRVHLVLSQDQEGAGAEVSLAAMASRAEFYLHNERAAKQRVLNMLKNEETLYGILSAVLFVAMGLALIYITKKLQQQLNGYEQRLILAGTRRKEARKAARTVWQAVICLLTAGILAAGGTMWFIHSHFPVNGDLLQSVMPFLFVNADPVGLRELDVQIGLWVMPVVVGLALGLTGLGKSLSGRRK